MGYPNFHVVIEYESEPLRYAILNDDNTVSLCEDLFKATKVTEQSNATLSDFIQLARKQYGDKQFCSITVPTIIFGKSPSNVLTGEFF